MKKHEKFIAAEIGIEFKAALYFYSIMFFYFAFQFITGSRQAEIIILLEMVAATYAIGYIQVFLLGNFDEAEQFTWIEALKIIGCSLLYTGLSWLLGWFDRQPFYTALFFVFMLIFYGCTCWLYAVRRQVTTRELNQELDAFKRKKTAERCAEDE